ncbi:MAG: protein translocase subunit SecF [Actinomycetota bacterium]
MSMLGALYRGETNVDFRPKWRLSIPISAALLVLSLILLATRWLDLSIDFQGGGVWEVPVAESVTVAEARDALPGLADARIQRVEDAERGTFIRVQSGTADVDRSSEIVEALAELGEVSGDEVTVSTVGPTWGSQITNSALRALLLFFVAVAAYLAWRLEWRMAVGALIAVVHDLVLTAGVYSLFAFQVSPATVIALLTILGYSLYDTVVVFDKVLENRNTSVADGVSQTELINRSMNQVLMRSINTTITTVLPVGSMLVIGGLFLGGATLRDFALALFIGLLLGTYSSIFVAAPVLAWLKERQPVDDETRRRQQRATEQFGSTDFSQESSAAGVAARPRKKRKR